MRLFLLSCTRKLTFGLSSPESRGRGGVRIPGTFKLRLVNIAYGASGEHLNFAPFGATQGESISIRNISH